MWRYISLGFTQLIMTRSFIVSSAFLVTAILVYLTVESSSSNYTITPVGLRKEIGEGPFWDEEAQLLFFVDMRTNCLVSYDPVTDKQVSVKIESDKTPVALMVKVKGTRDRWMVGLKGSLAVVRWDGRSTDPLTPKHFVDVVDPKTNCRLNDGKCDPANRLWAGSMGAQIAANPNIFEKDKGNLYKISSDGTTKRMDSPFQICNGLDWSLKADKMYFIDSLAFKVFQYDFDNAEGSISNRKVIYDLKKEGLVEAMNSLPDGMTVDNEGMLWVAVYGTQKVIRLDPVNGKKILEITIPKVLEITSVAFGGKDMDILFVTTGMVDWTDELEKKYPESGKLIKITGLGVKGTKSRDCAFDKELIKGA